MNNRFLRKTWYWIRFFLWDMWKYLLGKVK